MNTAIAELVATTTYTRLAAYAIALFVGACSSYLIHFAPKARRGLHSSIRKH